ncbi:YrdB family protein [Mucilaginibacter sp. X4EP1]|uniref:YrdB family protein n=1 Tax=Mucilaginibacter sp. X4EP1 TaxID=2723092 RepID=UPI00216A40CF|nr:YrdB family protein [Mucilaginibacter sp. X4EP1]MCS3813715.1 hypothetical protein [Mucilaginibacter sp. X4EP1]
MNTSPLNLGLRFLLEIVMLISLVCWGLHISNIWVKYVLAILMPVIAATLWGVFRIPNDPKPAPVETPGIVRLLLEWLLFGLAAYGLYYSGYKNLSIIMTAVVIIHYLVSYDRTWAMLRNQPYNGFTK